MKVFLEYAEAVFAIIGILVVSATVFFAVSDSIKNRPPYD